MKEFEEFLLLINKSIERDPWIGDRKILGYCDEIVSEVQEAKEALIKNDFENLKEEFGDILNDVVHAVLLAEKEGLFTLNDVLEGINEKLKRRKPYLLDAEPKNISKEEARRIWNKVKAMEKKGEKDGKEMRK